MTNNTQDNFFAEFEMSKQKENQEQRVEDQYKHLLGHEDDPTDALQSISYPVILNDLFSKPINS